jgi:hypothetical protein
MSTWTAVNLLAVLGKFTTAALCCLVTLAAWQAVQSLHQAATSLASFGHKNLLLINLVVALMPGCASP